ncbi:MAG: hypothetical protein Q8940_14560 [Bacteroidota bacterium]|nr:hypothetical protein [Bacteroidota bacterium]
MYPVKFIYIIAVLFCFLQITYGGQDEPDQKTLTRIRSDFYLAVENEDSLDSLAGLIEMKYDTDADDCPAVILAYYGALETLRAKYTFNPYSKFKNVISGIKKLNAAVSRSYDRLEIRFLRFAVLHNIPGIFGVAKERNDDLKVTFEQLLKKNYSSVSRDLQKGIAEFLMRSDRLEQYQTESLKSIFPDAAIK